MILLRPGLPNDQPLGLTFWKPCVTQILTIIFFSISLFFSAITFTTNWSIYFSLIFVSFLAPTLQYFLIVSDHRHTVFLLSFPMFLLNTIILFLKKYQIILRETLGQISHEIPWETLLQSLIKIMKERNIIYRPSYWYEPNQIPGKGILMYVWTWKYGSNTSRI